jgi:hypothetical protein
MSSEVDQTTRNLPVEGGDQAAIEHLKTAIASGKHWYLALLEAIALWASPEELYNGRHYRYLIGGEAFDWLLLAERLLLDVPDLIPEAERDALLHHAKAPIELPDSEFKRLIGPTKYRGYLNYFYGVLVEEALVVAVEEEVSKEERGHGRSGNAVSEEAYRRIYGASESELLQRFFEEKRDSPGDSMTLEEVEEFTYWRFKYRLRHSEKARIASDTKKALDELQRWRAAKGVVAGPPEEWPGQVTGLGRPN